MESKKIVLACAGVLALAVSASTFSGTRTGAVSLRLADGYIFIAQKRHLENTSTPTIELGYEFNDKWGGKTGVSVLNTDTKGATQNHGAHGFIYTLDGVYKIATYGNWEPYALGGVGITSLKVQNTDDPTDQANVNIGIGSHYFIDPAISLNAEAKNVYTMSGGKNDVILTAGVTFYFGGEAPKPTLYKS